MSLQDRYSHEHQFLALQQGAHKQFFEKVEGTDYFKLVNYVIMFCKCGEALMAEATVRNNQDRESA